MAALLGRFPNRHATNCSHLDLQVMAARFDFNSCGLLHLSFRSLQRNGHYSAWLTFLLQSLRWTILGSMTLVVVLTTGCISSERGTLADSVLSRGISRYQYFLGKWHARLVTVIGTFLLLGSITIIGCIFSCTKIYHSKDA